MVALHVLMLVVVRALGQRTVGNFSAFDVLIAPMLGEVVDEIIYGDVRFIQGVVVMVTLGAVVYADQVETMTSPMAGDAARVLRSSKAGSPRRRCMSTSSASRACGEWPRGRSTSFSGRRESRGHIIERMKTLLISGDAPPPAPMRDVVARGSTALQERRAVEVSPETTARLDVDRVVFWAVEGDAAVRALARLCVRAERAQRREAIVFVTPQGIDAQVEGLSPHELFEWPRDEDRLKMAFMTSA